MDRMSLQHKTNSNITASIMSTVPHKAMDEVFLGLQVYKEVCREGQKQDSGVEGKVHTVLSNVSSDIVLKDRLSRSLIIKRVLKCFLAAMANKFC
jgi:hypothetical protein